MKTPNRPDKRTNVIEMCPDDELLIRYVDKETTEEENQIVEAHLDQCRKCLEIFANLIRLEENPVTEEEIKAVKGTLKFTPEEQVKKIFSYYEELKESEPVPEPIPLPLPSPPVNKVPWKMLWPAAAVILLVALWVGGVNPLLTSIEASSQFAKAEELMHDSLRIYFEDVRLSGNYNISASGTLMSGEATEKETYQDRAESHIQKAIEKGATSPKAFQLLAEIYIAKGEFAKADSILQELRNSPGDLAPVLNNLGVSQFKQKHWQKAADYFQQATEADPGFPKALFNLALAEKHLGDTTQAISQLQKYMELETNEVGRSAAEHIIHELQTSGDDMP